MTDSTLGSIILVEDEESVRRLVERLLTTKGYRVESFQDAEAAIERMERGNSICLVIIDVKLPGMDGFQLAEWTRQHHPSVPILFLTGDPTAVQGPNHVVIGKPINNPKDLLDTVWQHIKIGQMSAGFRELKTDFGMCLDKMNEVSEVVNALSTKVQEHLASAAIAMARQDAAIVGISSRSEAAARAAQEANTKADSVHSKIDAITIPSLVTGWKAKWDPILTGVISLLFMGFVWLATEYKDQIVEKALGVDRKVKSEIAASRSETKADISQVRAEVNDLKDQVKRDSIENKKRQLSIEVGQYALGHNMDKILDKLNVPTNERAVVPSASPSPPPRPEGGR